MKHIVLSQVGTIGSPRPASPLGKLTLLLLPAAVLVSSCGGDGNGTEFFTPILQIGMQRQYVGTATRTVVYANPTSTLRNNTLVYTFTQNQTVVPSPAGAPGPFDVHVDYTYNVTQDPGVGTVPISQTVDNYDNLLTSDSSQSIANLGQAVVTVSNDETSDALGNGPYTETSSTTSAYLTPRDNFSYPLQTGATMTTPQSQTQTITFADVNASGASPSNGTNIGYSQSRSENNDGSYAYQTAYVNGNTFSRTQNSDGSGIQTFTNATSSTTTTVALPATVAGVSTIPVAISVETTHTTTTDYSAADWYPDAGVPSSPLVLETRNVVGPSSSLPAECNGAVLRPGIFEIDTTTTDLNPIGASNSTTTTRNFSAADGASICQLSTDTALSYTLDTGALVSTTTTTTTTLLSSINY